MALGALGMHAKLLALCIAFAAAGFFYTTNNQLPAVTTTMPGLITRQASRVIVVGSGLAGTAAALEAADAAGPNIKVVVLEKEPRTGGNSMKASSGINALTPEQGDTAEDFRQDTVKSGGGLSAPELVDALVVRTAAWLPGRMHVCLQLQSAAWVCAAALPLTWRPCQQVVSNNQHMQVVDTSVQLASSR